MQQFSMCVHARVSFNLDILTLQLLQYFLFNIDQHSHAAHSGRSPVSACTTRLGVSWRKPFQVAEEGKVQLFWSAACAAPGCGCFDCQLHAPHICTIGEHRVDQGPEQPQVDTGCLDA